MGLPRGTRTSICLLALASACAPPSNDTYRPWPKGIRYMTDRSMPPFSSLYIPVWEAMPRPVAVYRVVWFGAFHRPFSVTVVRDSSGSYFAHLAEPPANLLRPDDNRPPIAPRPFLTRRLSQLEWDAATEALESGGFWSLEHQPHGSAGMLDGSSWQIEGYETARRYHWSICDPGSFAPYQAMALPLVSLMLDSASAQELY